MVVLDVKFAVVVMIVVLCCDVYAGSAGCIGTVVVVVMVVVVFIMVAMMGYGCGEWRIWNDCGSYIGCG